jgi:vacuolar-type H+-ATPase subunit H
MRNSLFVFLSSLVLLITPSIAVAQTAAPTTHQQIQTLKSDYKQTKSSARTAFKEKLTQIKDTRKQAIVDKVDSRIQEANTKRTTQMSDALTRLTTILDKVSSKVIPTTPQAASDLLTTARTKIATAKTSVESQKNKDYVIQITTDATLAQAVRTTLQTFSADLTTTHKTVVDARSAVVAAIKAIESENTSVTPTEEENNL